MSTSLKACIQFVAVIGGFALFLMICLIERRSLGADLRNIAIVAVPTLLAAGVLLWDWRRPDREPDLLRRWFHPYFEHEGFCFAIRPTVTNDGLYCFDVFYQNRFERECEAILAVVPSRGFFLMRGQGVAIRLPLRIPGGAFGGVRVPLDIPDAVAGKRVRLDVTARVRYPQRRGRMIRFRPGLRVGKLENPNWERVGLALNLVIAPMGAMAMSTPATFEVALPERKLHSPPADFTLEPRVLWRPGDPVTDDIAVGLG